MTQCSKFCFAAAALVVVILLAWPARARASYELELQFYVDTTLVGSSSLTGTASNATVLSDGTIASTDTVLDGASLAYSGDIGSYFTVKFGVDVSASAGVQQALLTQSDNTVKTLYTSGTHTLEIVVSARGFTSPSAPPLPAVSLSVAGSGTEAIGSIAKATYSGYASTDNNFFGVASVATPVGYFTFSQQQGQGGGPLSTSTSSLAAPYSLTDIITLKDVAHNTNLTNVTSNLEVNPLPVPSSAVLVLTGLPLLGLGWWARRWTCDRLPVAG